MRLFDTLKKVSVLLSTWPGCWAVCGGVAASLYRDSPRFTGDIDIALIDCPTKKALDIAEVVAKSMGYKPTRGFVTNQKGELIAQPALLVGRETTAGSYIGIDFLLPVLPWIPLAVERAQMNQLDYGFGLLPTITPEDLIVAKLFAFNGTPDRFQDLDDIESVLRQTKNIDRIFIEKYTKEFNLKLPPSVELTLK